MIKSFRIFRRGWNTSTKGKVLFDALAAKSVMDHYLTHGADIMIDLEHKSLNSDDPNWIPDAYGWCKLAVINGELWATDVRWTDIGAQRLEGKVSRYISPAFTVDKEGRVTEVINVALCAMPATHMAMPLVAANRDKVVGTITLTIGNKMDLAPLLELLGLPPEATIDQIIEAIKALMMQSSTEDKEAPAPPAEDKETMARLAVADETIKELSREVATLKQDKLNRERDELIAKHTDKIPPSLEKWARMQPIESLQAFIKDAPVIVANAATQPPRDTTIELTPEEETVIRLTGASREKVLAFKARK